MLNCPQCDEILIQNIGYYYCKSCDEYFIYDSKLNKFIYLEDSPN